MITKEGSIKIINFMTPGAGVLVLGHGIISHIRKMHYFFKNLLLLWGMIQTNKVHSNDDHGRVYQNCECYDHHGRGSFARA